MDLQTTFIQNLSSAIQTTLTALQTPEFLNTQNNLLSALQQGPDLSQIDTIVNELTSIPLHPYDRLMWEHFEPEHNFKTIDDIEDPGQLPAEKCIEYITKKEQEISSTIFHNLTCCPEHQVTSGFEFLSGDQIVCNYEKQRNYLEFFEMVRRIPINNITSENCTTILNKLISEYIKVL